MGKKMKILHLCLSCFYIDDAGYQENHLVRQHVDGGHDVLVIASTETFDGKGGLRYTEPRTYIGSDGAKIIRVPYVSWLPQKIARKLRIHPGIYKLIQDFRPEAMMFHGCAGNEIVTVARYAASHPNVLLYADSHEDFNNSARNFVSKNILHRLFYRNRMQTALPHIRKVLCINLESMEFMSELYGVSRDRLEFFPLGGNVLAPSEISDRRLKTRAQYGLSDDAFVFLQSGKMSKRKKLADSLEAFAQMEGSHLRFWITGLLVDEIKEDLLSKIETDPRINFLGWKSSEQLNDLLCAADVYLQPGTQSVTMQNALCCGCPVIIADVPGHQPYVKAGATLVNDRKTLLNAMRDALTWDSIDKRSIALRFARKTLDYKNLAMRLLKA
ncbi:glycosyltransferase family 4 protein [Kordiimonas lipolytica]|uniref:Glycosyltransferase family 4 protein n=2 Tax=Kordiimonas lipolytica TaxID=1662421 RepID=A0ABV8U7I7_9PROT